MEQLKKIWEKIKEFWSNLSKKNRFILVGGVAGIFMVSLFLAILLNRVDYTVLYSGLSSEETAVIYGKLKENGENVKMQDNEIMVPKERAADLQMQMAIEGYPKTGLNYGYLTDNIDFMSTDYEKQTYAKIMLQENIVTSIKTIGSIRNAYVIINLPTQDDFVLQENRLDASASIMLDPVPGEIITPSQIKGILELTAKSVPGLRTENISIVDSNGKYLEYDESALSSENDKERDKYKLRLDLQRQLDAMLVGKVRTPLEQVYGKKNVAVSASVQLDYDIRRSESQNYTPSTTDTLTGNEKGMTTHEEEKQVTNQTSLAQGIPGENENADIPEYPDNQADRETIISKDKSIDYAVNSLLEQYEKDGYAVTEMTVAVLINKEDMPEKETQNLINIVAKAAGVDTDDVSVMGIKFIDDEIDPAIEEMKQVTYLSLIGAGVLLILVILGVIIASFARKRKAKKEQKELEEELSALQKAREENAQNQFGRIINDEDDEEGEENEEDTNLQPLDIVETKEIQLKKEIKDFTTSNPEIVAQLLRIWLKGEDE